MLRVALALFVGLALGIALGLFAAPTSTVAVAGRPDVSTPNAARRAAPAVELRAPAPDTRHRPIADPREEVDRQPAEGGLFSRALLELAAEGIRQGWRRRRADEIPDELHGRGMDQFEDAVRALPERIGVELADEYSAREEALADARTGDAFHALEILSLGGTPVPELVTNAGEFDALFPRTRTGPTVHAESVLGSLGDALTDGATLSFPAGVFELRRFLSLKTPFPDDVTLTGAGMTATLLVLGSDWSARSRVRRLELRDCTIYTNDNYLFDQRQGPATVLLERVRVIGMDFAAGASCVFSFRGGGALVRARDCRFEGGYGDGPGSGNLFAFRTKDAVAARFERCTVSRIHLTEAGLKGGTTLVFDGCRLDDMLTSPRAAGIYADPPPGLVLASGTSVTLWDRQNGPIPPRDLNQLFPDWKERLVR